MLGFFALTNVIMLEFMGEIMIYIVHILYICVS